MITIKQESEIAIMREGGRILAEIMDKVKRMVVPGMSTQELDRAAQAFILQYKVEPAFKNYENFPTVSCTSVNEVVVHGVPSNYKLQPGDLLCFDLGIKCQEFFLDAAFAVLVGKPRPQDWETTRLIRATKKAMQLAVAEAKAGNHFGDISHIVQTYIESQGLKVVRELCGHGIGRQLHEEPQILNYGQKGEGPKIEKGMTFCLEPMVVMGDWQLEKCADGFGWCTKDRSWACHFEHTVAITKKGTEVLTKMD